MLVGHMHSKNHSRTSNSFLGDFWGPQAKLGKWQLKQQDAQLLQRDRAAGYISFGQKWKTGTQRQYFTDIVSLASTTVT